ncbi:MAG: RAMP superfamily CRISPR-associated protein [Candidatus Parabeggiatoa sp.]|nr:RAMP superfamily CRISPR-associated protein [Candidatus Parabeggiatoa sp.]
MARKLSTRLTFTGKLQAKMPLHVGGIADSVEEDMPLARNGLGELYVPGTSLAGVFRSWMERHFDDQDILTEILNQLWGPQQPKKEPDETRYKKPEGWASRVFVEEAKVILPRDLPEELWNSVGINRKSGTAEEHVKFDRTVLPKGTLLDLALYVDLPLERDQANTMRAMLGYLMKALQDGQMALGAATTRGLGQVKLMAPQLREVDWTKQVSILSWLADKTDSQDLDCEALIAADKSLICRHPNILQVEIDWSPVGPMMTKASYDGIAVDILPRVSGVDNGLLTLVLPGSTLKGVLRNQAERIVRTVLNRRDFPEKWLKSNHWIEQLEVPLVDYLFGTAKKAEKTSKTVQEAKDIQAANPIAAAGKGCLTVRTCYAQNTECTTQQWQEVENAKSTLQEWHKIKEARPSEINPLYTALDQAGLRQAQQSYFEQAFHLGIDRWTGGAADGFLYSALEPFQVKWEPIEMRLDLGKGDQDRLPNDLKTPAVALLLLLLRDLSEQRLPIGFGVNRGYGTLNINKVTFKQTGETENPHWLNGLSLEKPFSLNKLPETALKQLQSLQSEWQNWVNAQKECPNG